MIKVVNYLHAIVAIDMNKLKYSIFLLIENVQNLEDNVNTLSCRKYVTVIAA